MVVTAPAAIATAAYLNARTSFSYDVRLLGSAIKAQATNAIREKRDKLNLFYVLEGHALGKQANAVFIISEGKRYTYKETYEVVLKYGTWLKLKHNVKPKDVVAMDFMNSAKFVFIWFGLWAIGAKPAFINYSLTGKALTHCVTSSTAQLLLVDAELQDIIDDSVRVTLAGVQIEILNSTAESDIMSTVGVRQPDTDRSDDKTQNMACLIFTSGTTGLPKPAIVSWAKMIVGSILVPTWASFQKSDILYTVSAQRKNRQQLANFLTSVCHFIMVQLLY